MLGLDVIVSTAVGAVGGIAGKWIEKGMEKDNREHELLMAQAALEQRQIDYDHAIAKHELGIQDRAAQADDETFLITQGNISKHTGNKFVDGLRSLTRVVVTIYLIIVASKLSIDVSAMAGNMQALTADEVVALYKQIISNVFNLTGISVGFWFGSRFGNKK